MPEAKKNHEASSNKSNPAKHVSKDTIINFLTLVVLSVTMCGVYWYASEARNANQLTREVIETQSRPYLKIKIYPETFSTDTFTSTAGGLVVSMQFSIENIGKFPAYTLISASMIYQRDNVAVGWRANGGQERRFIFPGESQEKFHVRGTWALSEGDLVDMKTKGYVRIMITLNYGHSSNHTIYTTRICQDFIIRNGALQDGSSCPEDDCNFAN